MHEINDDRGSFLQNLVKLFSGNICLGVISLVSIPLLSWFYNPAQIGEFQSFLSVIIILSSISTLRLEDAIFICKNERQKIVSYFSSIINSFIFSTVLFFLIVISGYRQEIFQSNILYAAIVALSVFFSGFIQSTLSLYVSTGRYRLSILIKIQLAVITNVFYIGMAVFISSSSLLMVYTYFCSLIFISAFILKTLARYKSYFLRFISSLRQYKYCFFRHIKFPKYNLWITLFNNLGLYAPTILIFELYGAYYSGLYAISLRLLDLPLQYLVNSFSQIFTKYANEKYLNNYSCFYGFVYKSIFFLIIISFFYLLFFMFLIYFDLQELLPENWSGIKNFIIILVFCKCTQLIASPISGIYNILHLQHVSLWITIPFVLFRLVSLFAFDNVNDSLVLYSFSYALNYLISLFFIIFYINKNRTIHE